MSIAVTPIVRTFTYNGILLPDVPGLSPREVRDLYSAQYPELVSAEVEAGEVANGRQDFSFRKAVGTKGTGGVAPAAPRLAALLARVQPAQPGPVSATAKLSRALSQRAVVNRSAAWSRFAGRALEQHRSETAALRASVTSDMLTPLP
ncbi:MULTISPECIES: PRTRC system protein C [Delftia]|uniref:PRTRC system protein C n=1 Tax=Delftia lacustris TaxID=558537 RepID=A0A1H3SG88_9BURK|nr:MULTISPECIES: PRTRC system protein C [Delftia]EPD43258.1 PRTRC system protein C [Delftia acidovorans CCUG 274B]PZP71584.1 MAG: PRTRC system protein C [Delftia acidovorans]SDZ36690.1 PRTRC system protein C [Delftia lacustris]